ncbi:virulence RhuM family protein [Dyadobacter koreensis]|uniref:virulence RhuM family protein n=1 Tax=Dyadobacter koreensis TaxID=408657 RepID=UPI000B264F7D|nr:RhuM family protein [Dyadobacter koreensis]
MEKKIEIFQSSEGQTQIEVKFEKDTVWLNRSQLSELFGRDIKTLGKHINNVFDEGELEKSAVVANFATTAADGKVYKVDHYSLDVIISVGYRVKSKQGTQFRKWATQRLKDYLIEGYIINEQRLAQKEQQVQTLKDGIRILGRAIESKIIDTDFTWLSQFAKGLELLDDYDHEELDRKGISTRQAIYPKLSDYQQIVEIMKADFDSDVFGK